MFRTQPLDATVLNRVIAAAKDRGMGKLAVEDPVTGPLSYGKLLTASAVLAARFRSLYPDRQVLGVMLPNANGACAAVLGVMSAGKVPAMINFTAGAANILSACKAADVRTVLTSRAFVAQAKLDGVVAELAKVVDVVWLDDLRETVTLKDKLAGLWHRSKPLVARKPEDAAVILFTSGSEGTPKGVVLTHRNMLANIAQAASRIDFNSGDKVFNVLPMFHSFGLTAGTILPLVSGVPVYLYPSPLHYRIVPELVYQTNATIIFGTDTFLGGYARTAHPYDFRSVRYCFAGAEPIKASTRATYLEKFGVRILEGYGVTEAAPVIAINTPMYNKPGSVGKLMPGIEYRLEPVPGVDAGGRLFIRGPNVMAGYLRTENPGVLERPEDGWHDTGDIVSVDADGFVSIRGRAKRFAKIGGEMVSLAAVEALAGELWKGSLSAAATMPDDRKGERLVLLTNAEGATRSDFLAFAKLNGAMDVMVPAEIRVLRDMPVLGSGKVDFVAVAKLVREGETSAEAA
jgi:acyl-[acyl-carrier-protein]-phospholipid O-acyltransferase/long-chain-fatty-acid--[acyl-carrier-protein] ligase